MIHRHFIQDILLILISLFVALWLVRSESLGSLLMSARPENAYLGALIAGVFFTSAFTTAPAIILLGKISLYSSSPLLVAIFGATGALLGDLIIFRFIHQRLRIEVFAMAGKKFGNKLKHIFQKKIYHHYAPFMAAVIIASPLPDELGLAIVGLDSRKQGSFELFSFIANFAGILIIALIAQVI